MAGTQETGSAEGVEHDAFDVFISYSHADEMHPGDADADERMYCRASEVAELLTAEGYSVWWDRKLLIGDDWHETITTKMHYAHRIVALSKHALSRYWCRHEANNASGLRAPDGQPKLLPIALEDLAEADFPPDLYKVIARFNRIDWRDQPAARDNLLAKLALKPNSTKPTALPVPISKRVSYTLPSGASRLIGRNIELSMLRKAWGSTSPGVPATQKTNVVVVRAVGGAGKTALMRRFFDDLADTQFAGAARVFGWSAYSQGSGEDKVIDADAFLNAALRHFGHDLDGKPIASAADKGHALAKLVGAGRNLLVIDGLEPLQHPPHAVAPPRQGSDGKSVEEVRQSGAVKDKGVAALIRDLATANAGLLIITSRQEVLEAGGDHRPRAIDHDLAQLSSMAGAELLRSLGVWGTARDLAETSGAVEGHALSLSLLGTYLSSAHGGDVRKRDELDLMVEITANAKEGDRKARRAGHIMKKYVERFAQLKDTAGRGETELSLLRMIGLFDRPVPRGALEALLELPVITGLTECWHGSFSTFDFAGGK
jgi:hypothetical protein